MLLLSIPQEVYVCTGSWTFLPRSLKWWGEMEGPSVTVQHKACSFGSAFGAREEGLLGRDHQKALRRVELSLDGWAGVSQAEGTLE